jgi:hypothetical protein
MSRVPTSYICQTSPMHLIKIHLMQCQFVRFYYIFVGEMNDFRKLEKVRRIDASKQFHIKAVVQCYTVV